MAPNRRPAAFPGQHYPVAAASYSPQLNPIENVWAYLRGNQLNRRVWDSYDEIVDACCTAWNGFINNTTQVKSITERSWPTVNI